MPALARPSAILVLFFPLVVSAQTRTSVPPSSPVQSRTQPGTLVVAGQQEQAPVTRINGHPYIDIESLARITHATVRYVGSQIILTLPHASPSAQTDATTQASPPQLSGAFLAAEIEALTAIREWRVSLVNAVQNNYPIEPSWIAPLHRFSDEKLQLAAAAASTEPDQKTLELLRNEFANMQQESDTFVAMRARINYIPPDSFNNNSQDQKILTCQRALAQVAASKQFQDDVSCH
ncbi:MAG TPA: hypothetical protein VHU44_02900 [Acidobacteriaceae bacterium]|jgi:hypothetical protein|nr:hypothetical protein [Acidobacteriaceae bacterium]